MTALSLAAIESFFVGGERRPCTHPFGHSDETIVGAMYVQRLLPAEVSLPVPVILIQGGCHTGVTWETTPDGREGWATLFARAGIDTYVVDQPLRGRSAVDMREEAEVDKPSVAGLSMIDYFARGGRRFPSDVAEHYASQLVPDMGALNAMAQGYPGMSDPRALPAFIALVDRIGPAALVTHSQGADIGWKLALARPDKVAAIVAIEPGLTSPGLDDPDFPDIPVSVVWGDNLPESAEVLSMREVEIARGIAERRPNVSVDHLPDAGITGNGHMLMMEDNSDELAERAIEWLRKATRAS